ncbi:hypothetical protein FNO01nite_11850 [Flavobacterium noncentrifugens]|uniref:TonB protein C-terminal n=1 Tax=Flavobacterium noncentrifugens TaxID=1128970 RepID=A0A1G8VI56_9FLAO|nr:energy transducer TonB [Flavobacterium noncentrifugens]GEP50513.1 hypothetical protein FNO01nite_11850 [Flavobacterium noncentrifugens]SDJ65587.1 TonB protein C-terminal [Flavobacterium noncentrifugens]
MNKYALIVFLLLMQFAFCQTVKPIPTYCPDKPSIPVSTIDPNEVFVLPAVDQKPEFPGGLPEFYTLFHAEFKAPAQKPDLNGRQFVSFTIEKDGSLSNIRIIRDLGMGIGAETIRVLQSMPHWKPAVYQQKTVRCNYTLPVTFPYEASKLTAGQLKNIAQIKDKQ